MDGYRASLTAVEKHIRGDIDYTILVKMYGAGRDTMALGNAAERSYKLIFATTRRTRCLPR
jgi:hypothetical protein